MDHAAREERLTRWVTLAPGLLVMVALYVVPIALLSRYSFYRFVPGGVMQPDFTLENYQRILSDSFFRKVFWDSVKLGVYVTAVSLVMAYPLAYYLARARSRFKGVVAALVLTPLLTSIVVSAFGWMVLLADSGLINQTLLRIGLISEPIKLLFNMTGVVVALTQSMLPFMVISLRATLYQIDPVLEEAAATLGARPAATFVRVTLPLSLPGVAAGGLLVFIGTVSAFVTPALLGGGRVQTIATVVYEQTLQVLNWPLSAALSVVLLIVTGGMVYGYNKLLERAQGGGVR